jgi:hypothetical protein
MMNYELIIPLFAPAVHDNVYVLVLFFNMLLHKLPFA